MTHNTGLASESHHHPHFTDVTMSFRMARLLAQGHTTGGWQSQDLNPGQILPAHNYGVPSGDPQLPEGCQEVAGEVTLLEQQCQISDGAMETSAGAWVRGRSPGRSQKLQSCLEACLPPSVLVSHGHGPSIVLRTPPAQGLHIRDFRRPGQNYLHFPEELSPGGRWPRWGLLGRALAAGLSTSRTCPGPRDGPPRSALLKPREEKALTHFHFRAG